MRISDWSSDVCSSDLTRLQDFTTGSRLLIPGGHRLVQINVAPFDAVKHGAEPVVADARLALEALGEAHAGPCVPPAWRDRLTALRSEERCVGTECVSTVLSRRLPLH